MSVSTAPEIIDLAEIDRRIRPDVLAVGEILRERWLHPDRLSTLTVQRKSDGSKVTNLDLLIDAEMTGRLRGHLGFALISEEQPLEHRQPVPEYTWLLDPIDGTRNLVAGSEMFVLSLGLLHNRKPVLGYIYHPPSGVLWSGYVGGRLETDGNRLQWKGPETQELSIGKVRAEPSVRPITAVVSGHDLSERLRVGLRAAGVSRTKVIGSALKFAVLAEGDADLYMRIGPTNEWDIAAGHALLSCTGGSIFDLRTCREMNYDKPRFSNGAMVAFGARAPSGEWRNETVERIRDEIERAGLARW